jgi:hypothetical protein
VQDFETGAGGVARRAGRPSLALPYVDCVRAMLGGEPQLSTAEILRRLRLLGYRGGKSAIYPMVAALRQGIPVAPEDTGWELC